MTVDIVAWISVGLSIIGGATLLLQIVAPLTKTKLDNKVLRVLEKVLEVVSLNKTKTKLEIKIK